MATTSVLPLHGIIPPVVTPLAARDQLDTASVDAIVHHLMTGGVHGIFALGSTGEGPGLSHRLRAEMVRATMAAAAGRLPVIVGITDTSFTESLELAAVAADAGAAAVVAAPPYYFPMTQDELVRYYLDLADALPLPLFLYNMPAMTKVPVSTETVRRIMDHPRIIGMKDSSGDMLQVHALLQLARPGWPVMVGQEQITGEAVLLGASGGINAGANLEPATYTALYEAARAGDLAALRRHHGRILAISSALYAIGNRPSSLVRGIKAALALMGLCPDRMAEPFHAFTKEEAAELRSRMEGLGFPIRSA
ncbi:MAG: dihydrodipicolinate synthase family protein [Verrucomicrobiota bacterium]